MNSEAVKKESFMINEECIKKIEQLADRRYDGFLEEKEYLTKLTTEVARTLKVICEFLPPLDAGCIESDHMGGARISYFPASFQADDDYCFIKVNNDARIFIYIPGKNQIIVPSIEELDKLYSYLNKIREFIKQ